MFNWYSYYRPSSSQFATHYLIIYEIIFFITWLCNYVIITSTSDIQPSTAIVNQLPGQLVSTEIS